MKFHADMSGARLFIHRGVDVGDSAFELAVWQIREANFGFLPQFHKTQVLFIDLRLDPDQSQVSQAVKLHPCFDHLALYH